eukprot:g6896.t1
MESGSEGGEHGGSGGDAASTGTNTNTAASTNANANGSPNFQRAVRDAIEGQARQDERNPVADEIAADICRMLLGSGRIVRPRPRQGRAIGAEAAAGRAAVAVAAPPAGSSLAGTIFADSSDDEEYIVDGPDMRPQSAIANPNVPGGTAWRVRRHCPGRPNHNRLQPVGWSGAYIVSHRVPTSEE